MAEAYVPAWDGFIETQHLSMDEELTFLEYVLLDLRINDPDTLSNAEMETCYQQFKRWLEAAP